MNCGRMRKILPPMIAGLGSCVHEIRKQKRKNGIKEIHNT
jgi:hypothetical protein